MKLLSLIFTVFLFVTFSTESKAQENVKSSRSPEEQKAFDALNKRWNDALGTFQIQVVNSRINPVVGVEIIERIESERKENEIVYIAIRENVRIMVLPKKEIQKANFVKISYFQYVQE
jgi:hypothetical protein